MEAVWDKDRLPSTSPPDPLSINERGGERQKLLRENLSNP
jgi:hypothetical protein